MRKKINLETKILAALYESAKEDGGFMTVRDIGIAVFGDGYMSKTSRIFDKMIRERMFKVRELAETQGRLIVPRREGKSKNKEIKLIITGWKIATENDKKFIEDELLFKLKNRTARQNSLLKYAELAVDKGMLPGEKMKELDA